MLVIVILIKTLPSNLTYYGKSITVELALYIAHSCVDTYIHARTYTHVLAEQLVKSRSGQLP